jgi:hypothetical protein
MNLRFVRRSGLVLGFLAALGAQPVEAQVGRMLEDVAVRMHGGVVVPFGAYADYFNFGPSVGLDFGLPVNDRMDLKLDLDWDYVNTSDIYPSPNTNLLRYRVGVEADILGDRGSDTFLLSGLGGVGLTTSRSTKFWLASRRPYTYDGETLNETALSAVGGVRAGLRTPDGLTWWLTGKMNWTPVADVHQEALRELARNELGLLGSALSFSITLGVSLK